MKKILLVLALLLATACSAKNQDVKKEETIKKEPTKTETTATTKTEPTNDVVKLYPQKITAVDCKMCETMFKKDDRSLVLKDLPEDIYEEFVMKFLIAKQNKDYETLVKLDHYMNLADASSYQKEVEIQEEKFGYVKEIIVEDFDTIDKEDMVERFSNLDFEKHITNDVSELIAVKVELELNLSNGNHKEDEVYYLISKDNAGNYYLNSIFSAKEPK